MWELLKNFGSRERTGNLDMTLLVMGLGIMTYQDMSKMFLHFEASFFKYSF